ncbi:MAG: molybdopterin converting factor subunit 1 [Fimbriimonadaceae bacterium]|nr:molybdopterin converting factor subunit 1 [Fimbriimonadaceae bacterium]
MMDKVEIRVSYFASLRDQAGMAEEKVALVSCSVFEVYQMLARKHKFDVAGRFIQYAVNSNFVDRDYVVAAGDHVVFIPPVSGG